MNELKVNLYAVLSQCIEEGINGGWVKAQKWSDFEIEENIEKSIKQQIEHYIMLSISEKFKFD